MKVTYIGHSGFAVEFEESVFIFDYYEGKLPEFSIVKQIYYFVSHKHQDHFNRAIFKASLKYPNVTYILSNDVKMSQGYMERIGIPQAARENIQYVHKNEKVLVGRNIEIETLRSTDEGVAYLICYKEQGRSTRIYHAGDLNWWSWSGESEQDNDEMAKAFMVEMEKLKGRRFNLAFVPLDPRQEERFWWGFDTFMKTAEAEYVFPMHCWEDYTIIDQLLALEESKDYRERVVKITARGQEFVIEDCKDPNDSV